VSKSFLRNKKYNKTIKNSVNIKPSALDEKQNWFLL